MSDTLISIIMLAAVFLLGGAAYLSRRGQKKQATLMVILAFVMFANVVIWLIPVGDGGGDDSGAQGTTTIAD